MTIWLELDFYMINLYDIYGKFTFHLNRNNKYFAKIYKYINKNNYINI